uniref:NAD(P)H-quinone oxidoreductase subunit 5, chloroplastic n=1 Tax=Diplazium unilobum TaxID=1678212 RepID=A0A248RCV2_9MONI
MPVELSNKYACLIPLCPLVASRLTGSLSFFFPKATKSLRRLCATFNTSSLIIAMFVSFAPFRQQAATHSIQQYLWARIPKSDFRLKIGFLIDPLTLAMSILATTAGISAMVYSDSYMCHDQGYARFYAYPSLFAASMLGLVFSPNLIQIYVFRELVGMCSYLLIGFWFARSSAANACQKAFVTNRVGDFGLLLGVSGVYWITGSSEIFELCDRFFELNSNGVINPILANTIAPPPSTGPVAKSAQFPLHVWLPDAMEGPTPISALIHAATMVAAGIFFTARIFNPISTLPPTMLIISWVGGVTTLPGATLALAQEDLKKGLAYSTMSQLGYMVPASGIGASRPASFHLITHAYSKALLFLGSGSVIHSMEKVVGYSPTRSQNMFFMGGLRKCMPITGTTFPSGTLSLCGIPPLSCFWSKDQIIAESRLRSPYLGLITSATAGLTASYTSRIYLLTFEGNFRANRVSYVGFDTSSPLEEIVTLWGGTRQESLTTQTSNDVTSKTDMELSGVAEARNLVNLCPSEENSVCGKAIQNHSKRNLLHPQESNLCMASPLIALAIPTAFAGLAGVDSTQKGTGLDLLFDWLISIPSFPEANKHLENLMEILTNSTPSLSLSFIGLSISLKAYGQTKKLADTKVYKKVKSINEDLLDTFASHIRDWSINRGYFDYYYNICFAGSVNLISKLVFYFDRWVIDGFINGTGASSPLGGEGIRQGRSGRISHYLLGLVIGVISPVSVVDLPIPPLP